MHNIKHILAKNLATGQVIIKNPTQREGAKRSNNSNSIPQKFKLHSLKPMFLAERYSRIGVSTEIITRHFRLG